MKLISLIGVVLIISVGLVSAVAADGPTELDEFAAANLLYEDGNYEEAARSYERLLGLGYEDAALHYNLGNAYFRMDDMGRAILNFLRANRLAPLDDDIQDNLDLARAKLETANYQQHPLPLLAQLSGMAPWITLNQTALITLLMWLVLGGAVYAFVLSRQLRGSALAARIGVVAIAGVVAFGSLTFGSSLNRSHWEQIAVVTAESTDLRTGPSERYGPRFALQSGSESVLIDVQGGWTRLRIPRTEIEGWVRSSAIEPVLHRSP